MRLIALAAAALLATLPVVAVDAQPGHHGVGAHRDDHRARGGYDRHDRRYHRGGRDCRIVYRHHHRERRCR